MTDYDRWLEQPYQEQAERDDAIDAIVEEVLQEPEFDPTNADTFLQAIDDATLYEVQEELAKALKDPEPGFAMTLPKLITAFVLGLTALPLGAAPYTGNYYTEPYRPLYHYSPEKAWMNDPNGLVYHNANYHMF